MQLNLPMLIGLIGAAVLIVAYLLNQAELLASTDWRFPFCNFLSSGLIAVSLCFAFNLPALIIEVFWMAISIYGMLRARRRPAR